VPRGRSSAIVWTSAQPVADDRCGIRSLIALSPLVPQTVHEFLAGIGKEANGPEAYIAG
jgi:hypothetical protein